MQTRNKTIVFLLFVTILILVIALSIGSNKIWQSQKEEIPETRELVFKRDMTVAAFGQQNDLPRPLLKKVFGLKGPEDLQKPVSSFSLSEQEIKSRAQRALVIEGEAASKNWNILLIISRPFLE